MFLATPYTIRTTVFESGERLPMLVRVDTGLPLFNPCVYATTVVRPNSGSPATIEQALRGVQFLLTYAALRDIDLDARFGSGEFLGIHELDDLVALSYRPMKSHSGEARLSTEAASRSSSKVVSLERVRRRASKVDPGVATSTVGIRLYYVHAYLQWLGARAAKKVCSTLQQKESYMELLNAFLANLRIRTPNARGASKRFSLTPEEKTELLRVIDPESPDNPWTTEFVRDRNRLLVYWNLGTGLRRGDLLGQTIRKIDFRRNMADIVRRPDDRKDPRKHQPNNKTRERSIDISENLAHLTHEHIVKYRSNLRDARKHDFLFVAETGKPLSLSALSKIYRTLRAKHPILGEKFSSHVLRHTWNEDFSEVSDKANLSDEDERRARNHAMGWADTSKSADHYLKRRTRRKSAEASIKIQQGIIGSNGEDETNG